MDQIEAQSRKIGVDPCCWLLPCDWSCCCEGVLDPPCCGVLVGFLAMFTALRSLALVVRVTVVLWIS
jgi:hypothetical protein